MHNVIALLCIRGCEIKTRSWWRRRVCISRTEYRTLADPPAHRPLQATRPPANRNVLSNHWRCCSKIASRTNTTVQRPFERQPRTNCTQRDDKRIPPSDGKIPIIKRARDRAHDVFAGKRHITLSSYRVICGCEIKTRSRWRRRMCISRARYRTLADPANTWVLPAKNFRVSSTRSNERNYRLQHRWNSNK